MEKTALLLLLIFVLTKLQAQDYLISFEGTGAAVLFWSTTAIDPIFAWNRNIFNYTTVANRHGTDKKSWLSVRCVKY